MGLKPFKRKISGDKGQSDSHVMVQGPLDRDMDVMGQGALCNENLGGRGARPPKENNHGPRALQNNFIVPILFLLLPLLLSCHPTHDSKQIYVHCFGTV